MLPQGRLGKRTPASRQGGRSPASGSGEARFAQSHFGSRPRCGGRWLVGSGREGVDGNGKTESTSPGPLLVRPNGRPERPHPGSGGKEAVGPSDGPIRGRLVGSV